MARLPSNNNKAVDFPGAPVLLPPPTEHQQQIAHSQLPPHHRSRPRAVPNALPAFHPSRSPLPPPMPTIPSSDFDIPSPLHIRAHKFAPNGPRAQPAQSVLKNALALRRMNSEANDIHCSTAAGDADEGDGAWSADRERESRRYVRMGREASPLLPWFGGGDLEGGGGGGGEGAEMDELFDFGFAAAGAEEEDGGCAGALDEMDLALVGREVEGALAGFEAAAPASDDGSDYCVRAGEGEDASVWEDGERFWNVRFGEDSSHLPVSPLVVGRTREKKSEGGGGVGSEELGLGRRSIQMTPRSLYDSDGFLRT